MDHLKHQWFLKLQDYNLAIVDLARLDKLNIAPRDHEERGKRPGGSKA